MMTFSYKQKKNSKSKSKTEMIEKPFNVAEFQFHNTHLISCCEEPRVVLEGLLHQLTEAVKQHQ